MLALITENPHWIWLSLGGLLLIAEMLGTGGYLLWSGVAAAIVGTLVWLFPGIGWEWQGCCLPFWSSWSPTCGGTGCAPAPPPTTALS
ncbi:hypothetical protein GGER_12180 [Serratia rubidaea]